MATPQKTSIINLESGSQISSIIKIDGHAPLSIQAILTNVVGSPTYTLEVSNDLDTNTFKKYDPLSNNIDITDAIVITYDVVPWKYLRLVVTPDVGDVGLIYFNIFVNE